MEARFQGITRRKRTHITYVSFKIGDKLHSGAVKKKRKKEGGMHLDLERHTGAVRQEHRCLVETRKWNRTDSPLESAENKACPQRHPRT